MSGPVEEHDTLEDFEKRTLTFDDEAKSVYVAGSGPGVIVMSEVPGITPTVARFARWVRNAGFTVWMPSLYGTDGAAATLERAQGVFQSACVAREFQAFAGGEASPMASWLRQLAAHAHDECGGPGVGAIGMCFTGNFALTLTLEPSVLAPVMSQPALPLDNPAGTFISPDDMAAIKARLDTEDLTVLAYRFEGDSYCQAARFDAFSGALGDRFVSKVLPDSDAGEYGWTGVPHSVVTTSLVDEAGHPTIQVRDEILEFFTHRLQRT